MSLPACLLGVLTVVLAFTGARSNSPPTFSEIYYVDSVSENVENDGLLASVTCSDADGDSLVVMVTSVLSFGTRVAASGVSPDGFDIIVDGSIDLSVEFGGIQFTVACSDGVANDTATVALNVVPTSDEAPQFMMPLNPVHILASVQSGATIAKYRASEMGATQIMYHLDELVKDSVPFTMSPTSGELMVSGALLQERYDLIILADGSIYTTRISVVVLINFQPMFEQNMVSATLDAGAAKIGDTVVNFTRCSDQNLKGTANGNLSVLLQGSLSMYFRLTQEGSLEVMRLLRAVSGGLYQLIVNCSDTGLPEALSDELIISLQLIPAAPGVPLNYPPLFSQDVYIDSVDGVNANNGLFLTTLFCTDEDDPNGELLTVSIQPGSLPFAVSVERSTFEANGYDVITNEMVDFELYEQSGLRFNASCSDGTQSADTFVVLDIVPESFDGLEIISIPAIDLLETTANNTDIGTFSFQSGVTPGTPPQYSVTVVFGNEGAEFRIHPTLGNLSVSGVLNDERYLVVVAVFNGEAISTAVTTVSVNFKPVFTNSRFMVTVIVSDVNVGDSIGAVSCTDRNSEDTPNGNLTLQLQLNATASPYFSLLENGTVVVSADLNSLLAVQNRVNGYITCTDNGQPEGLSSMIEVSIALQGPATTGVIIPIAVGALLAVLFLWLLILVPCMLLCLMRRCSDKEKNKRAK